MGSVVGMLIIIGGIGTVVLAIVRAVLGKDK